ncbi:Putative Ulp1 protease family catalytic domain, papain-like cysteine peptidase superfamily [Colletotrichum destructivum]|uniref:Ulp1 protease family catalytic domain, papain-like cysteine peptidase superfamily n=1 Tax=Colletotrichum destructivum TaxID=34406 RepID=A0AAX4J430_9PEZI|nr:Putative Ulp1 protease family catalytic domain, papain-like cysteine peptidase superfamily [Colletotrichum destructivum]
MNTASAEAPKPSESSPHCYQPGYAVVASSSSIIHRCIPLPQANAPPGPTALPRPPDSHERYADAINTVALPDSKHPLVQDLVCNIIEEDVATSNELARLVHTSIAGYPRTRHADVRVELALQLPKIQAARDCAVAALSADQKATLESQLKVQKRAMNAASRREKYISFLDATWNGRTAWLRSPYYKRSVPPGLNFVGCIRSITISALSIRLPLDSLWQPGGELYEATMKVSDPPTLNLRAAEDAKKAMDLRVDGMAPVADRGEDEQEQEDVEADKCGSADSPATGSLLLDDDQSIADSDQDSVEAPRDAGSLFSGGENSFEMSPLRDSNGDDDDDFPAFPSPIQNTDDAKETPRRPGDVLASLHHWDVAIRKLRRSSQQQSTVVAEEKRIVLASNNSAGEHKGKGTSPAPSPQHPLQDSSVVAGHPETDKVRKDEDATKGELLNSNDIPAPKADTTTIDHLAQELFTKIQQQLSQDAWLTDDVVDALIRVVVNYYTKPQPSHKVTVMYSLALDIESPTEPSFKLLRHLGLEPGIQSHSIYIPLHHKKGTPHWTLAILQADRTKVNITHLDSVPDQQRTKQARALLTALAPRVFPTQQLEFVDAACPRQNDGHSCGIHVAAMVRFLAASRPFPERFYIAVERKTLANMQVRDDEIRVRDAYISIEKQKSLHDAAGFLASIMAAAHKATTTGNETTVPDADGDTASTVRVAHRAELAVVANKISDTASLMLVGAGFRPVPLDESRAALTAAKAE